MRPLRTTAAVCFTAICVVFSPARAELSPEISNRINKSVYQLYAYDKDKVSIDALGSAVAITPKYLVTNCHVALAGNFLILNQGGEPHLTMLCYFNQIDDLCVISVAGVNLEPAAIRPSKSAKVGEDVYAVGFPKGKKKVITQGKITNILKMGDSIVLQTNASITLGSSGGGLFDKDGYLIGITTAGMIDSNVGYAIPTELIMEAINPKFLSCKIYDEKPAKMNPVKSY